MNWTSLCQLHLNPIVRNRELYFGQKKKYFNAMNSLRLEPTLLIIQWSYCDNDIVSQGSSEAPKLMSCQRENVALKQQASLCQCSVVQGHENSCFSWAGMNQLQCCSFLWYILWNVTSLNFSRIFSFKRSWEFWTRGSTCL